LAGTWRSERQAQVVAVAWAAVTFLVPTAMRTKLPWYLNSFYPAFALGVGWLIARGLAAPAPAALPRRRAALAAIVAIAFVAAESRLVWYSYRYRDLTTSAQGLLLSTSTQLNGHRVYLEEWNLADVFALRALVGAREGYLGGPDKFWTDSAPGDFLLTSREVREGDLLLVAASGGHWLYRRCE
jgi:4-amino-4-deoxy-L-arabinose transferase-like glycosyltransferase